MVLKIQKVDLTDRDELEAMLLASLEENELGMKATAQAFRIKGEESTFILGIGPKRRLNILEFGITSSDGLLERALARFHQISQHMTAVSKIVEGCEIDVSLPPKVLFLSCFFSRSFLQAIPHIDRALELEVYQVKCLEVQGNRGLLIEHVQIDDLPQWTMEEGKSRADTSLELRLAPDLEKIQLSGEEIRYFLVESDGRP